jgi:hypothetical protein
VTTVENSFKKDLHGTENSHDKRAVLEQADEKL